MTSPSRIPRRDFVRTGVIAASAAVLGQRAAAAEPAGHTLAPLPYPADALEPHLDARTMDIHHGKHHAAYVKGLNDAVAKDPSLAGRTLEDLLGSIGSIADPAVRTAVRNHGGGHWNHTLFWNTMAPAGKTGAISQPLAVAIDAAFGSLARLKQEVTDAAMKRFGSGWAWLVVRDGKLGIVSTPNQDNPLMKGVVPDADLGTPLLGIDVWEHAYYLHYQNRRADYIAAWWNVVDWNAVSKRFS
ncbi:MAG: superoxide dismutase [Verrucomicrobia bacterium]|nr:superoxide dismutase [Verrucomicrobiota bacterium]